MPISFICPLHQRGTTRWRVAPERSSFIWYLAYGKRKGGDKKVGMLAREDGGEKFVVCHDLEIGSIDCQIGLIFCPLSLLRLLGYIESSAPVVKSILKKPEGW
ncbi:uncharacterized protein LOC116847522 isoform X2 [Odontomachus brunneus]|uniref:uncharacterized protein LOC116847522 isoform X2 n=1 Tax=Odontomachus brunneus TaxID=486640 RepID=UPI0013F1EBAF|nr:uncharacterized protein LOC116847522 isoform X2 [Odontomachus brunneus]